MERLHHRRKTPSFSSSLLDSVLRSIDDLSDERRQLLMSKKQTAAEKLELASVRQVMTMEKWINKQSGRSSASSVVFNSGSSSSESSCGGNFSSSEAEASSGGRTCFSPHRSKFAPSAASSGSAWSGKVTKLAEPRNSAPKMAENRGGHNGGGGGNFMKTKSKSVKFYGDLKKVNQPISPGRRIANFINSLFGAGNGKKVKMCSFETVEDMSSKREVLKSVQASACSSRSCLSKTSPSRTKLERSVRFYPVSIIVDEDCRPCGQKCLHEDDPSLMPTLTAKNLPQSTWLRQELDGKRTRPANKASTRDIVRESQNKISREFKRTDICHNEDDDDDAESYSSSDLFELDHIAIGRYREELPVYGTTSLGTNHSRRT